MAKVAGTAEITIDGVIHRLRGNMKCSLGGFQRESIVGLDGFHGIKETPMQGYIECDLTDAPDLDNNVLEQLSNVTVKVRLINGKVGVLGNAYQVNKLENSADDGKFTIRFEGPQGQWIPAPTTEEQTT